MTTYLIDHAVIHGNLRYANGSAHALRAVADLIEAGKTPDPAVLRSTAGQIVAVTAREVLK